MDAFLGCDPGAKGAICILYLETKQTLFYPTPGGKDSLGSLFYIYQNIAPIFTVERAAIESVHSIYGMSAKSNFNFGYNVGATRALLESCLWPTGTELELIQPKAWQKAVGITAKGKEIKKQVAEMAHELYPDAELYGPKGGLKDGRADALMIAHSLTLE